MDALRLLVYKIFLEIFYGKRKERLTFLTRFYISNESSIKTFLKMVYHQIS